MQHLVGRHLGNSRRVMLAMALWLIIFLLGLIAPATVGAAAPAISAGNAIVFDPDTRQTLFVRGGDERIAPASLTKIMTALVALEEGDPAQVITILPEDLVGEASMGLQVGQRVTLRTLLYGLLLPSGNDAAMAIARGVGAAAGDPNGAASVARFVGWMNLLAARLSLKNTHLVNPHGLDADDHYSSATDLASLTGFAWQNPMFAEIFGSTSYASEGYSLRHGNRLIGQYDGVVGGKTGLTDGCGFCLVTAAMHAGHRLVVVVLRDTTAGAFADTTALLTWSYGQVETAGLVAAAPPRPTAPPAIVPTPQSVSSGVVIGAGPVVQAGQPAILPAAQFSGNRQDNGPGSLLPSALIVLLVAAAVLGLASRGSDTTVSH